jgi:hypothetical protein
MASTATTFCPANKARSRGLRRSLVLIGIILAASAFRLPAATAILTVNSVPEQAFKAFGFSITLDDNPWLKGMVNSTNWHAFDNEAFDDLNAGFARWWFSPGATHSYNMAATPDLAAYVRKNGRDYWQTEAGGDAEGNTAAARFLNDLNNRVTHWSFFIGPASGVDEQQLLSPSARSFTYYYLRHLASSFVPGTIIRHTTSSIEGEEMTYT